MTLVFHHLNSVKIFHLLKKGNTYEKAMFQTMRFQKPINGAREMAHWVRTLDDLLEDPGSVAALSHLPAHFRGPDAF